MYYYSVINHTKLRHICSKVIHIYKNNKFIVQDKPLNQFTDSRTKTPPK